MKKSSHFENKNHNQKFGSLWRHLRHEGGELTFRQNKEIKKNVIMEDLGNLRIYFFRILSLVDFENIILISWKDQ